MKDIRESTDLEVFRYIWESNGILLGEWVEPNATHPKTALELRPDFPAPGDHRWYEFDNKGRLLGSRP